MLVPDKYKAILRQSIPELILISELIPFLELILTSVTRANWNSQVDVDYGADSDTESFPEMALESFP